MQTDFKYFVTLIVMSDNELVYHGATTLTKCIIAHGYLKYKYYAMQHCGRGYTNICLPKMETKCTMRNYNIQVRINHKEDKNVP